MFSGIVEELCCVNNVYRSAKAARITIGSKLAVEDTVIGDSISVNGVCLTVVEKSKDSLTFEAMPETLKISNLGQIGQGDKVNTERALKIGDRLGGHFVTGHIDCSGLIRRKYYLDNNLCFDIAVPQEFMQYVILKGSIAIDGISLTITNRKSGIFSVYIIPHTFKNTTLGIKGPSDKVNIEFDILAKR
ncbi:MAG: riboflavin synthase [Candidatus Omnitrophota bacterium]|jgi:riboflavin synthase